MRVAVTLGTLRIPPTYFAVQHTQRLLAEHGEELAVRTFAMAIDITDPQMREGGLDIVEVAALPGASFRRREVTMPLSFGRMTRAIRAFEPDVVHQHFATWSTPAVAASRRSGSPLLVTLHGADVFAALRPLSAVALAGRPMLAWHHASVGRAFRQAHRLLPVSRYLADRAIEAGADPAAVEVHYQGIDTDYFTPASDGRALDGIPEVIFVGALSTAKGILDLVDASVVLARRTPHRLVVIGRGPLEGAVRAAAAEHPHIDVLGSVPRDTVRERLRRASALVLPTQFDNGWREAAGLVLLEAQACGVPVVAYDSGGAPEMVDDGRTGLVVAERDLAALGDAIGALVTLPAAERARMAEAARGWVVERRSLAASARQLLELYAAAAR